MEFTTSALTALLISFAYVNWLYLAINHRQKINQPLHQCLVLTLGVGLVASLVNIFPADNDFLPEQFTQPELAVYLGGLLLVFYGALTLRFFQLERYITPWYVGTGLWWLASTAFGIGDNDTVIGSENWLSELPAPGLLILAGWGIIGTVALVISFYNFYKARLPEIANRALIWAIIIPIVTMGTLLGISGSTGLREMGWIIQVLGLGLVAYGVISVRALDLRQSFRWLLANGAIVGISAIFLAGLLFVAHELNDGDVNQNVLFIGLAIGAALIFSPLYLFAQNIVNRLLRRRAPENITPEIRRFAEAITGVVEMEELANVVMQTLKDTLGIRRGALLLATTDENNTLRLEAYEKSMGEVSDAPGFIKIEDQVYNQFMVDRKPLLQFDLDFAPDYQTVDQNERAYFKHLQMAVFAPVIAQERLLGVLACGPKTDDSRFSSHDLELLSTIANQTGIALRNARLVQDVLKRERDVAETNKRLEIAKRQLEALDSVKTDFITIASHELRTPLAQIRGHTDIIQALNEQGMMDQDQLSSLTGNLRKAADRLEGLIGDMLDVSQLDLSAMDLRFAETTVESAVRLAVEPLQESIRNRKQSLTARGLRGLPAIEADMQRLVQAVRNIVLNAVKFTPDGGRIDIIGRELTNEVTGEPEIEVTIKDSGIGIDPKNREAIFEKFFRAFDPGLHSTGKTKFMGAGPGLGLTIAQGVIEGHGGRIWVESDGFDADNLPGSTFYIVLPVNPPKGARRVLPISSAGKHFGTQSKLSTSEMKAVKPQSTPPSNGDTASSADEKESGAFEEPNPTVLNPSANRAGLTAALQAAAEEAREIENEQAEATPNEADE